MPAQTVVSGTGTFVAAATTAAGRDPIILGKPSTYIFEALTITHPEVEPSRTLMIGDKSVMSVYDQEPFL
jgi:phosphoglycolate phosphatase